MYTYMYEMNMYSINGNFIQKPIYYKYTDI